MPDDQSILLRQHGLQVTAQRLAVLRAVSRLPHCTADEVADAVRTEIGAISRQAVYDALGLLAEKGVIRRIRPAGSPALFEDRVGDDHHHLICRGCGHTVDVDAGPASTLRLSGDAAAGFRVEEAEVIYWGTCPACLVSLQEEESPESGMRDPEAHSPSCVDLRRKNHPKRPLNT